MKQKLLLLFLLIPFLTFAKESYTPKSYVNYSGSYYVVTGPTAVYDEYVPYDVQIGLKSIQLTELSKYVAQSSWYYVMDVDAWTDDTDLTLDQLTESEYCLSYDKRISYRKISKADIEELFGKEFIQKTRAFNGSLSFTEIGSHFIKSVRAYINVHGECYEIRSPSFQYVDGDVRFEKELKEFQQCYLRTLHKDMLGERDDRCVLDEKIIAEISHTSIRMRSAEGSIQKQNVAQALGQLELDSLEQLKFALVPD